MYHRRDQGPRGGAEHLARIHGTEEDKVNCPFYFKIGACRHGDRCSRQHHRPPFSQTILIQHMWQNPMCAIASAGGNIESIDKRKFQEDFDDFYCEIFEELQKYGKIEEVQVCENLGEHMVGNVYAKFDDEEEADEALKALNGRFFAGRQLRAEFSPVTDFREARCRQYDEGTCARGAYCNFMHVKGPSKGLRKYLEKEFDFRGGNLKGTGNMQSLKSGGGGSGGGRGGGDRRGGGRTDDRGYNGGGGGGYRGGGGGRGYDRDRGDSNRDSRRGDRRSRSRDRDSSRRDRSRDRDSRRRDSRDRDRDRDRNQPPRDDSAAVVSYEPAAAEPYVPDGI